MTTAPFSNGTESMMWFMTNCHLCAKGQAPELDYDTTELMVRSGKYCCLKWELEKAMFDEFDDSVLDGINGIGRSDEIPTQPPTRCRQFVDHRSAIDAEKITVSPNQQSLF